MYTILAIEVPLLVPVVLHTIAIALLLLFIYKWKWRPSKSDSGDGFGYLLWAFVFEVLALWTGAL